MVKLMSAVSVVVSMVVALALIGRPTHSTEMSEGSSSPPPVEVSKENLVDQSMMSQSPTNCDGSIIRDFFQSEYKDIDMQPNSDYDALGNYLVSCGYEEFYTRALNIFEGTHSRVWFAIVYPSLRRYFDTDFKKFYRNIERVERALHIISNLHKVHSIPDEAGCKFFKTDLISWLFDKFNDDVIDKLTQAHFELALEKSGLNERFMKRMTEHGIKIKGEFSSLANYLFRYRNKEYMLRYALYMIDKDQADGDQVGCAIDLDPLAEVDRELRLQ